jgi:hypothetical protein
VTVSAVTSQRNISDSFTATSRKQKLNSSNIAKGQQRQLHRNFTRAATDSAVTSQRNTSESFAATSQEQQ